MPTIRCLKHESCPPRQTSETWYRLKKLRSIQKTSSSKQTKWESISKGKRGYDRSQGSLDERLEPLLVRQRESWPWILSKCWEWVVGVMGNQSWQVSNTRWYREWRFDSLKKKLETQSILWAEASVVYVQMGLYATGACKNIYFDGDCCYDRWKLVILEERTFEHPYSWCSYHISALTC